MTQCLNVSLQKGILNNELRIAPLSIKARSKDGPIPHKIFEVTSRSDKENNNNGIVCWAKLLAIKVYFVSGFIKF